MERIHLEGADVAYHRYGSGPVIILIPGANGTGGIFKKLAKLLAKDYTVIAVDRRGYGKSKLTSPLPDRAALPDDDYRVKRDAADIAAIAREVSDEPVYIMGTSSGAIVAMHVLLNHAEVVKHIVFHEPPNNYFLPDAAHWQASNNRLVHTAQTKGMPSAMRLFAHELNINTHDARGMLIPAVLFSKVPERYNPMMKWFLFEMRQYTSSKVTIDDLRRYRSRISLVNGIESRGAFPYNVNLFLGEQLSLDVTEVSGGHLGYQQYPAGFNHLLRQLFH